MDEGKTYPGKIFLEKERAKAADMGANPVCFEGRDPSDRELLAKRLHGLADVLSAELHQAAREVDEPNPARKLAEELRRYSKLLPMGGACVDELQLSRVMNRAADLLDEQARPR